MNNLIKDFLKYREKEELEYKRRQMIYKERKEKGGNIKVKTYSGSYEIVK